MTTLQSFGTSRAGGDAVEAHAGDEHRSGAGSRRASRGDYTGAASRLIAAGG